MKFRKMHGLGNDFVVLDGRAEALSLRPEEIARMGSRHFGVGFDQLVLIEPSERADIKLRFWNSDGSEAGACGNATRCSADIVLNDLARDEIAIETKRGMLAAKRADAGLISVNMGQPQLDWREIPLAHDADINALPIGEAELSAPMAVGMGNPHCVFFVEDAEAVDLATIGPRFEHDPLFPERTNVEFASLIGEDHLRMRVWERGGMITLACGSGACATAVAAHRRGLTGRKVKLTLDGGEIEIDWRDDGVWMTGPVAYVFAAEFDDAFFAEMGA